MTDISHLDALAQADLVRRGEVSAAELLEAAIARAEAANPALNFLAQPLYERARRHTPADGPFAGVPFLVKDLHTHLTGERSGEGSHLWDGYVADHNSTLVDRLEAAGFAIFGKTTTPEFGLTVTTESAAYGRTRNPWAHGHSAGGSSGGSACAVAAGVVPMAQASDGGGSIRCPAAACGVFGLKPSRGRVPMGPKATEGWLGLSVNGAVSWSVRDNAAFLDAVSGPEPGSRYTAPAPAGSFLAASQRDPHALRVAIMERAPSGVPVHSEVLAALHAAGRLLESLGHHVEIAQPELPAQLLADNLVAVIAAATAHEVGVRCAGLDLDTAGDRIEPITQMFVHIGQGMTGMQLLAANQVFQDAARTLAGFLSGFDIILSPVFAQPVIELGKIDLSPPDVPTWTANITGYSPFTALANQTGLPAMSLPLGMSSSGLPIGIMATGRYGEEALLYSLAGQIERAAPWANRRPPAP